MLTTKIFKLEELNSTLRDEHTALHLLHCSVEEKLRKIQTENSQIVKRLMENKTKDAEKMNEENDSFVRWVLLFYLFATFFVHLFEFKLNLSHSELARTMLF